MCSNKKSCKSCSVAAIGKPSNKMAKKRSKFTRKGTVMRGAAVGLGLVASAVVTPKIIDYLPESTQEYADVLGAGITGFAGYYLAENNPDKSFMSDAGMGMIGGSVLSLVQKYAGITGPGIAPSDVRNYSYYGAGAESGTARTSTARGRASY